MTTSEVERKAQEIRAELAALQARIRRLEIEAGIETVTTIPQQRLEELVDGATGKTPRS